MKSFTWILEPCFDWYIVHFLVQTNAATKALLNRMIHKYEE